MNTSETQAVLALLKLAAPHIEVTDGTVHVWEMVFADIPAEAVTQAAREWIKTRRGWPWPAEIREIVAERWLGLPSAEEAWVSIQKVMNDRTLDPATGQRRSLASLPKPVYDAVTAIGGRTALYHADDPTWLRKEFTSAYATYRKKAIVDSDLGLAVTLKLEAQGREAIGDGR